jgi:predicted anti-sigma-YlaC factor YlaD
MLVTCEHIRAAISARLDGEPTGVPDKLVDAHVAECPGCAGWQQQATALKAAARATAEPPDLVARVLTAVRAEEASTAARRRRSLVTRSALALIAVVQLALSVPGLLLGHDHTAPIHVAHEVGSFEAALAIGLLLAACWPRLAAGMLPLVAAITGLLLLTAGSDVATGRTTAAIEWPHLLDLSGLLLLLRLAITAGGWTGFRLRTPQAFPTQLAGRG